MEDIINEGVITIMKGIDRFNPDRDNNFEIYVMRRIRGVVTDLAGKSNSMSKDYHKQSRAIENARMQPVDESGRQPSDEKIADHLSIKAKKYKKIQRTSTMMNALSSDMVTNEEHQSFQIASEDTQTQPEQAFPREEVLQTLIDAVNNLGEKERAVISFYHAEELDMTQIAGVLQISEPRVSQIHSATTRKLKAYMNKHLQQEEDIMYQGFCNLTSGTLTQNRNLNVIGNNMVNVQTPGYKNDITVASTFSEGPPYRIGKHYKENAASLAIVSKVSTASRTHVGYGQGSFEQTDGIYDFVLDNKGSFCIQIQNSERYTRDGLFAVDDQGYFVLPGIGRVISTDNQPIQIDNEDFQADESGMIFVLIITGGDDGDSEMEVEKRIYGILKMVGFADCEQFHKEDSGMISTTQAPVQATEGEERTQVLWKTLKKSNVGMVKEMTVMMPSQRVLQSAAQVLKMYDQIMSKSATDIGRL